MICRNILLRGYCLWNDMWWWAETGKSEGKIIFQDNGRFSEKPIQSLIYWLHRLQISKIHLVWCLMGNDLAFRDFYRRKFPTFSMGGAMR